MKNCISYEPENVPFICMKLPHKSVHTYPNKTGPNCTQVIFSSIMPIINENGNLAQEVVEKPNYLLIQLSGQNTGYHMIMETIQKKHANILISLYKNRTLQRKLSLSERLEWKLGDLLPSLYSLKVNNKSILNFELQN